MTRDSMESSGAAGRERPASSEGRNASGDAGGGPQRPGFGRDALGLVLLLLACFFGVAAAMAYIDPREQASGMTGLVMALVEFLGASCFFLAAGLGWIGFRLWIRGVDGKVGRDLLGVVITTFTLAILIGSLSPELGGTVGHLGAVVTAQLTVFVGLIFGVMVVLLPAWFLWLRPAALAAGEVPRTSAPLSPRASDSSGVSQAEAEGLFPKVAPRAPRAPAPVETPSSGAGQPAMGAKASATAADPFAEKSARPLSPPESPKLTPPKVVAPSPYPPDVRREGRVPEGARPLSGGPSLSAPPSASAAAAAPTRAPQPAHDHTVEHPRHAQTLRVEPSALAAGAGVVADELRRAVPPTVADDAAAQRGAALEPLARPAGAAPRGDVAPAALRPTLAVDDDDTAADETFADELARASVVAEPSLTQPLDRTPPKPSWEQSDLFEEPVDAYGTPLSLVEKLRSGEAESGDDAAPSVEAPGSNALAADADSALPWSEDDDLGDEVIEDSIRPLVVPAPTAAAVASTPIEAEAAPEHAADANERAEFAQTIETPASPDVAAISADEPALDDAAPSETSEELRQQLRGFIDLRERQNADESEPVESEAIETTPELEDFAVAATAPVIEREEVSSEELEPVASELADAATPEAPSETVVEAPVASAVEPEPAASAAAVADTREEAAVEAQADAGELEQAVELTPQAARDAHTEPAVAAESSAQPEGATTTAQAHERGAPSGARPQVVIRSLFEEPAATPSAPPAERDAPSVETSAAEVVPAPAAETPSRSSDDETAPLAVSDVVLEPARRGKRKPKAPRTNPDSAPAEASPARADESAESREASLAPASEATVPAALERVAASERVEADVNAAPEVVATAALATAVEPAREPEFEAPEPESESEPAPSKPRSRSRVTVDEVVFKAGCLFVERQRVAVSMLQREFGLDFDAATAVLDQLQRLGLIGPYLGGQRRDILLSMDEWQELVGVE